MNLDLKQKFNPVCLVHKQKSTGFKVLKVPFTPSQQTGGVVVVSRKTQLVAFEIEFVFNCCVLWPIMDGPFLSFNN